MDPIIIIIIIIVHAFVLLPSESQSPFCQVPSVDCMITFLLHATAGDEIMVDSQVNTEHPIVLQAL